MLTAAALCAAPAAASAAGPFAVQETGRSFQRLDAAVRSIGGGAGTIVIQPGSYRECAVVERGRVAFRAAQPGTVILNGVTCEGKAALVLRGRDAMIDGLVFENLRVPDRNGAGIRLEQGNLTVMNAIFRNSEEGILSADDPNGTVRIDRSTFSGLGRCDGDASCAHSVYIGHYGRVIVTRTRFERGRGGHYFKSRAARNEVSDSNFDDSAGHLTNYAVDLCAGSVGEIARNVFVQGRDKENHSAVIAIAAEARDNPSAGLAIEGNTATLAPGAGDATVFVADFSHEPLRLGLNKLGPGIKPFELR